MKDGEALAQVDRPCLKATVADLIKELTALADQERAGGHPGRAYPYSQAAELVSKRFVAFGEKVKAFQAANAPDHALASAATNNAPTTASLHRAHGLPSGRTGFIGVTMHDAQGVATCAITIYANAPGAPVTRGDAEEIHTCILRLMPALDQLIAKRDMAKEAAR